MVGLLRGNRALSSGYPLGLVASRLATFCTNSDVDFYIASHMLVTVLNNQFSCRSVVSTEELSTMRKRANTAIILLTTSSPWRAASYEQLYCIKKTM